MDIFEPDIMQQRGCELIKLMILTTLVDKLTWNLHLAFDTEELVLYNL